MAKNKLLKGTHTSFIDGAAVIVNRFAGMAWFVSVRAGQITTGKKVGGGAPFVSVKRHTDSQHKNTFLLTFKRAGVIQKIYVQVHELEKNAPAILADMREIVAKEWKGAELVVRE